MTKNGVLALLLLFSGGDGGLSNAFSVRRSSLVGARSSFTKRQTGASTTSGYSNRHPLAAMPLEVIDPSYNLALGSLALGSIFVLPGSPLKSTLSSILGGIPLTLFGLFLAYQTTTLRFTFDDTNFSLVRSNGESTGENVVVGGENVWAYNKFVNYDVL
jgi:NIMA (never in mitosis gene a)-related kinase